VTEKLNQDLLNQEILQAHADDDCARLADLYALAADQKFNGGDDESGAFLLTHAYVFALESGHNRVPELLARLVTLGRETL